MGEINHENVLIQLREALNRNGIKLWEEPYCFAGEPNESEMLNLANILCQQVNVKYEYCLIAINELQYTALDNLKSIDEFKETGVATLKVRIPCKQNGTKLLSFKIKLTENTKELAAMIAAKLETNVNKIKVIANGKVLDIEKSLEEQGVKNNKQILALVTESDAESVEDPYARIRKIRSEAEVLLRDKNSGFLGLEDQSGNPIHLPENERRSIILALLLYEKGRAQLKNEQFSDALILFLEADEELKLCNSNLVQSVDNVALLNLDIVWCYLNLKSIMQLPDAEIRLKICEENFKRSYGVNLSRVESVKGSSENEKCLIARMRLMQGILFFHQNRQTEATVMLDSAERDIATLKVDGQSVNLLIDMGYSKSEAVTGLRSSFNSVDGAVNFILERREKFAESRKEGRKERSIQKLLNNIGLTANPRSVIKLSEMGFPKELCALALHKSNDVLADALNLLQNDQNNLKDELVKVLKPSKDLVDQLVTLGFEAKLVENVLKLHINDFQRALEALLEMQRNNQLPTNVVEMMEKAADDIASSSANQPGTSNQCGETKKERALAEDAAFKELRNDLDHLEDDDEYLTITLEKEQALLTQYKNALRKQT